MSFSLRDKDILKFKPTIEFVEPEQEPVTPNPIKLPEEDNTPQEVADRRNKIKKMADAVNKLASAVQNRIDDKAKNQIIRLDSNVDAQVMMSMMRTYPDADPNVITYDQYRNCKENLLEFGKKTAQKVVIDPDEVDKLRDEMLQDTFKTSAFNIGGLGTVESTDGRLRPELDPNANIIEPMDFNEFQNELLKILANALWSKFLKPNLVPVLGAAVLLLPDELIPVSEYAKAILQQLKLVGLGV